MNMDELVVDTLVPARLGFSHGRCRHIAMTSHRCFLGHLRTYVLITFDGNNIISPPHELGE